MDKKQLRQKYKLLRQTLQDDEIEEKSLELANQLLQLECWDKTTYHIFLPIESQKEVNTEYVLQILAGKDKNIVVSKADFETREMTHFLLTDATKIKVNHYQIPEPVDGIEVPSSKIDVVFVPLLAYDEKGNRVGYGKGFYDKFLATCRTDCIKIGLSFFRPEISVEPVDLLDVKLDFCVTPDAIYCF